MDKNTLIKGILCLVIILICLFYAFPLKEKINLGLDLKGGMHLVFRADTTKLGPKARKGAQERALEILRNRIDAFGVREPVIQPQAENQIVIQLPGVSSRERALNIIGKTALLEFKLVEDDPEILKQAQKKMPPGYEFKEFKDTRVLLKKEAEITGKYIQDAQVKIDNNMQPYVALTFNAQGAKKFAKITQENVGRRLCIILDGKVKSAPLIREPIPTGNASISGLFTYQEAQDLALVLRAGALPCPLVLEEERTVGPLLGQDSINKGIKASIIAGAGVGIFMIAYYTIGGIIAVLGLGFTLLFVLGSLGYFHATLTLPGIAGIILTLGMAVDANVLIFERIREELSLGRSIYYSVINGYRKATSAILDSNITTLIAAFFLFQFGTGPIRGFALTLSVGLIGSMFSALVFSRFIMELLVRSGILKKFPMITIFKKRKIDFLKVKNIFFVISGAIIIIGSIIFIKNQSSIYGIDFSGGQLLEYKFKEIPDIGRLRNVISQEGVREFSLQQFREDPRIVLIKSNEDFSRQINTALNQHYKDGYYFLRQEQVGPVVGRTLKKKAIQAIIFALGGILVYVGLRFKHLSFGLAGVIALFHDVLIGMSFLLFTHRLIDLLTITGLLTLAGYSINDTIVIYDRIREIAPGMPKSTLREIINTALNQTLSRTIITSLTTVMVVAILYYKGGQVLNDFSFVLLVGFIAGTYSTIFIASPLVLLLERKRLKRR